MVFIIVDRLVTIFHRDIIREVKQFMATLESIKVEFTKNDDKKKKLLCQNWKNPMETNLRMKTWLNFYSNHKFEDKNL